MKVGLAEVDKKLMLKRKRKLFSRNLSKNILKRFQGRTKRFQKYPGKIQGRTERFQNILKRFWGGRKVSKISWKGLGGGRLQNWSGSLKEEKRENPTDNYPSNDYPTNDYRSPSCERDVHQIGIQPHGKQPVNNTPNQNGKWKRTYCDQTTTTTTTAWHVAKVISNSRIPVSYLL